MVFAVWRLILFSAMFYLSGFSLWGLLAATFWAWLAYLAGDGTFTWPTVLILVSGFCYALAGISVWLRHKGESVYAVLAVLWLCLGLYSLGYEAGGWLALDPLWQSLICIAGFGLIGVLSRHGSTHTAVQFGRSDC